MSGIKQDRQRSRISKGGGQLTRDDRETSNEMGGCCPEKDYKESDQYLLRVASIYWNEH